MCHQQRCSRRVPDDCGDELRHWPTGKLRKVSQPPGTPVAAGRKALALPTEAKHGLWPYHMAAAPCAAGAQRAAARLGVALVAPDTSPRGLNVPGEADSWDFGEQAGREGRSPVVCMTGRLTYFLCFSVAILVGYLRLWLQVWALVST
jgi:hypothetical protein